jgi:hypothetical protein
MNILSATAASVEIKGAAYDVEPISAGEHGTVAVRVTKIVNGESYDVVECSCPDFICRHEGKGTVCKHGAAMLAGGFLAAPAIAEPVPTFYPCQNPDRDDNAADCDALGLSWRDDTYCNACYLQSILTIRLAKIDDADRARVVANLAAEAIDDAEDFLVDVIRLSIDHLRSGDADSSNQWSHMTRRERQAFDLWLNLIGERFPAEMGIERPADACFRWDEFAARCVNGSPVTFPEPQGPTDPETLYTVLDPTPFLASPTARAARAFLAYTEWSPMHETHADAEDLAALGIAPVSGGSDEAEPAKPCPACGSESGAIQSALDLQGKPTWQVYCGRCDHRGEVCHDSPRHAVDSWNATPRPAAFPPRPMPTPQLDGTPESIPAALEHIAREYNAATDPTGEPRTWLATVCEQGAAEIRRLRAELAKRG